MSGKLPRQQKSRSRKGEVLETMTKEEVIETVKETQVEDIASFSFDNDIDTDEGEEEDGEHS